MSYCRNCGNINDKGLFYCQRCGSALTQTQQEEQQPQQPRPYGWASDSSSLRNIPFPEWPNSPQQVQPIPNQPNVPVVQTPQTPFHGYRCPRCGTTTPPFVQSKISDGGILVIVLMVLFCFPLFWIGLLMKEEYRACPVCLAKIG